MRVLTIALLGAAFASPSFSQPTAATAPAAPAPEAAAPAPAPAAPAPQGAGGFDMASRLAAMDTSKDGKVSKEEFTTSLPEQARGFVDQLWPRLDADADGFLTKEELAALGAGFGGGRRGEQ